METWEEIRAWRRATRADLLAKRLAVRRAERYRIRSVLHERISEQFSELRLATIGFYWPFKSEIDLNDLVQEFLTHDAAAALPVVVQKQQPLEFWRWRPHMRLGRGLWNIPVPTERDVVEPTAILVPLLGFDAAGYRLGYGGGYYDRTLATMKSKPLTIGVGYERGRLETIYPQSHDIPLDAIVTEAGSALFRYRGMPLSPATNGIAEERGFASPPCFVHELSPEYLGYLNTAETIALLNQLLEGEQASFGVMSAKGKPGADIRDCVALRGVDESSADFREMLTRHITRLGGTPVTCTVALSEPAIASSPYRARDDLVQRRPEWVVRTLRDTLPRIADEVLCRDLKNMLEAHELSIQGNIELR